MLPPISPRDTYMVYKQREKELELEIQRRLIHEAFAEQPSAPWYAQAAQWLRERSPLRVKSQPAVRLEEPCPIVPC